MTTFDYTQKINNIPPTASTPYIQGVSRVKHPIFSGKSSTEQKQSNTGKALLDVTFLKTDKSPEEKLKLLLRKYYANNPEFANKTDEQKNEFINKKVAQLIASSTKNVRKAQISEKQKREILTKSALLIDEISVNNLNLDETLKKSNDEKNELIDASIERNLKRVISLIPDEKLQNKTAIEKSRIYAEAVLSLTEEGIPTFGSEQEKNKYLDEKINTFVLETHKLNLKNLNDEQREEVLNGAFTNIQLLVKSGISPSKFNKMSPYEQEVRLNENISDEDKRKNPELEIHNTKLNVISKVAGSLGKECDKVSEHDIAKYLSDNEKTLSNPEKVLLKKYKAFKDMKVELDNNNANIKSNASSAKALGLDVEKYIEARLESLKDKKKEDIDNELIELYQGADDAKQLEILNKKLEKMGYSKEAIAKYNQANNVIENTLATGMAIDSAECVNASIDVNAKYGSKENLTHITSAVRVFPKYLSKPTMVNVGENIAQNHENLLTPYTQGLNDRAIISKEDAKDISTGVLESDKVSDGKKATYAKTFVESAKINGSEEQLYFCQELSKIKNAAVLEGLAAASKSVDKSVQADYNNVVNEASKQYPPEARTKIQNAQTTGSISTETCQSTNITTTTLESNSTNSNIQTQYSNQNLAQNTISIAVVQNSQTAKDLQIYAQNNKLEENQTSSPKIVESFVNYVADKALKLSNDIKESVAKYEEKFKQEKESSNVPFIEEMTFEENFDKDEQKEINGISIDKINELKRAYQQGGMSKLYDKLGEIGSNIQKLFLNYFIKYATITDIRAFALDHQNNRELLLELYNATGDLDLLPISLVKFLVSTGKVKLALLNQTQLKNFAQNMIDAGDRTELCKLAEDLSPDIQNYLATNFDLPIKGTSVWMNSLNQQDRNYPPVQYASNPMSDKYESFTSFVSSSNVNNNRYRRMKEFRYLG